MKGYKLIGKKMDYNHKVEYLKMKIKQAKRNDFFFDAEKYEAELEMYKLTGDERNRSEIKGGGSECQRAEKRLQ